ncbi:MAG: ZIP family metal transporter [Treponema sp.]|jgi:ZIP family zinc transporter|nr:ZIP family metal transporter [Treponema sp.]
MSWFANLPGTAQAFIATLFTYALTALGAATVFFFKSINRRVLDGMLGFAAGVMIAASFFSLLAPAIEMADLARAAGKGLPSWAIAVLGFILGGAFLRVSDFLLPHHHVGSQEDEGIRTSWSRSLLLVLAITLHNIPEGLAVGVGFGAAAVNPAASLAGALSLTFGIGLQNFPEGAAVSIPLRREGLSRLKSFWIGQASGIVEPVAGVLGAALVLSMQALLPYVLSFAAGAMIFVVAEELIPEAYREGNDHIATTGLILGFSAMMALDLALG